MGGEGPSLKIKGQRNLNNWAFDYLSIHTLSFNVEHKYVLLNKGKPGWIHCEDPTLDDKGHMKMIFAWPMIAF